MSDDASPISPVSLSLALQILLLGVSRYCTYPPGFVNLGVMSRIIRKRSYYYFTTYIVLLGW